MCIWRRAMLVFEHLFYRLTGQSHSSPVSDAVWSAGSQVSRRLVLSPLRPAEVSHL